MTSGMDVDGPRPAVAWVANLPREWLSDGERLLLFVLAADSFDGRTSAASRRDLAAWTGHFASSNDEIVARLEAPNPNRGRPALLRVDRGGHGRGRRNRYTFLIENGSTVPNPSSAGKGSAPSDQSARVNGSALPNVFHVRQPVDNSANGSAKGSGLGSAKGSAIGFGAEVTSPIPIPNPHHSSSYVTHDRARDDDDRDPVTPDQVLRQMFGGGRQ